MRDEPFQPKVEKPLPPSKPSGCRLIPITLEIEGLTDAALTADDRLFVASESVSLWKGISGSLIKQYSGDADFWFEGAIGLDFKGRLLIVDHHEHQLWRVESPDSHKLLSDDIYPSRVVYNPFTGRTLILSDDATHGTSDSIYQLQGEKLTLINNSIDLTLADDIVEPLTDTLVWIDTYNNRVMQVTDKQQLGMKP